MSQSEATWEKLSKFAVTGAEYDSPERLPHPKCLKETRVDLLGHIYDLLDDQEKNQFVWLNGMAGVGKSAVAFTVAEKMRGLKVKEPTGAKRLAGTFFFSRKYTDRCTTGPFFATLAHQLATNFPNIKDDLTTAICEDHTLLNPRKPLRKQMEALFLRPLRRLQIRLPAGCPPLVFVVDALDECTSKDEIAELISLLGEALRDPGLPVTHILLTSRSEARIREAIHEEGVHPLVCEIPVEISGKGVTSLISLDGADVDSDIYLFLKDSFTKLRNRRPLFPQPTEHELERLANRAGRRFIVASTMMKFIDDGHNDPHKRLQLMLQLTSKLLPSTAVYKLYDHVLSTCADPRRAYQHLSIVAALANPLPISQISELLGPGEGDDVETALVQLRSVMDIPADSKLPVNIYHSSVRDYVSNPSNCGLPEVQHITPSHTLLACSSLNLMIRDIPESMGLLDALSELKMQSQAMESHSPQSLRRSLAFTVGPPTALQILLTLLWLRGDRRPRLYFWLETPDGRAWLRAQGKDWLGTPGSWKWLQTRAALRWLQTHDGKDWLQTPGIRAWLQNPDGLTWLSTKEGEEWLWTLGARDWLKSQRGRDWLKSQRGRDWLGSLSGSDWLESRSGRDWLESRSGKDWLGSESGSDWVQSPSRKNWLKSQSGRDWRGGDWPQTSGGHDQLEKHVRQDQEETQSGRDQPENHVGQDQAETQSGRDQPENHVGQDQAETQSGQDQAETQSGRDQPENHVGQDQPETQSGRDQSQTQSIFKWLLARSKWPLAQSKSKSLQTESGRDWLQTQRGQDWLQTQGGQDSLRTQSGQDWLQTWHGNRWLQTQHGQEWLRTQSGQDWLQTQSGQDWLQTLHGQEWLQTSRGQDWLQTSRGQDWLQTWRGQGWLQTWRGHDWLQTSRGHDWLRTQRGHDWLQTHRGQDWLQTKRGQDWLQTKRGQDWLQTKWGRDWLQTKRGQDWLKTQKGQDWLQTQNGNHWLQTQSGQDWLQTQNGNHWLQTQSGQDWLQTQNGNHWLQTQSGQDWLQTQNRNHWLQTQSGQDWLQTQNGNHWLQTQSGQDWLQTQSGNHWLQTQSGQDWLQTQSRKDWLQTQSGKDWLQAQNRQDWLQSSYGQDWLQSLGGQRWLQTSSGQEWLLNSSGQEWLLTSGAQEWLQTRDLLMQLQTQSGWGWLQTTNGLDWLQTLVGQDWLQTSTGQDWLQTQWQSGQDWLQTQSGRKWLQTLGSGQAWLQTLGGREWLQTLGGQAWLQTAHGQAWQSTLAASFWVHMEEFLDTVEAINNFMIIPGSELSPLPAFHAIQQFKSLPDFLMFPAFLTLTPKSNICTFKLTEAPEMEIVIATIAFVTFTNEARERSQSTSEALTYACQNWAMHLSRVPNPWNDILNHTFKVFWDHHLLSWLERQWCLKGLQSCLSVLSEGQKLTQVWAVWHIYH